MTQKINLDRLYDLCAEQRRLEDQIEVLQEKLRKTEKDIRKEALFQVQKEFPSAKDDEYLMEKFGQKIYMDSINCYLVQHSDTIDPLQRHARFGLNVRFIPLEPFHREDR